MKDYPEKVLFVDDEQNLLDGIRRHLGRTFEMVTALSGQEGLRKLALEGPFAVVISDMRMPGLDGVQFLAAVKQKYPEIVRVMLTGNSDLQTAVQAVNEGSIFRFLNKPCPPDALQNVVIAALEQYRLIHAEKVLLEQTLMNSIKMLVDVLSLSNPVAFGRTSRVAFMVKQMANKLELRNIWEFEAAAMLSQIGCVTLPPEVLEKAYLKYDIPDAEMKMYLQYPIVGHDLIRSIPRLEDAAEMVLRQLQEADKQSEELPCSARDRVAVGAEMLRIILDFEAQLSKGASPEEAHTLLSNNKTGAYNKRMLDVLLKIEIPLLNKKIYRTRIYDLQKGMTIESDVVSDTGSVLVRKGQKVNITVRILLENSLKRAIIDDTVMVSIPVRDIKKEETQESE